MTSGNAIIHSTWDDVPICVVHTHGDGYPEEPHGFGHRLREFSDQFTIVNGLSTSDEGRTANGMECFAAQLIAEFKDGSGGIYLEPLGQTSADFVYHVRCPEDEGKVVVTCDQRSDW